MTTKPKNDGGAAFPRATTLVAPGQPWNEEQPGMTLRDWFAGMVLAQATTAITIERVLGTGPDELNAQVFAYVAYQIADAMLAERDKP